MESKMWNITIFQCSLIFMYTIVPCSRGVRLFEVLVKSQNVSVSNMLAMKQSNKLWSWVWVCYGKYIALKHKDASHTPLVCKWRREKASHFRHYTSHYFFFLSRLFPNRWRLWATMQKDMCTTMTTNSLAFMPFVWRGGYNFLRVLYFIIL